MTQLEYYTALLQHLALIGAFVFGAVALTGFAILAYYLYPFTRK